MLMVGLTNMPNARHLIGPDGSVRPQWYESTLVVEGGDTFYIALKQFVEEAYEALVEIAGDEGELEFKSVAGSMPKNTAQVDSEIFRYPPPSEHNVKKADQNMVVISNWMNYAEYLELKRSYDLRKAFMTRSVLPKEHKKNMAESDKCSELNGSSDDSARKSCDRVAHKNGKCVYHIYLEKIGSA